MQHKFRCQNIIFFTPINSAIVARRCIHTQARAYIRVLAFGLPRAHVHGLCDRFRQISPDRRLILNRTDYLGVLRIRSFDNYS